jgi:hypothetical protein
MFIKDFTEAFSGLLLSLTRILANVAWHLVVKASLIEVKLAASSR